MKNSKKGVTLVELVICCAIIVMLGGACSAIIASGSAIFSKSSSAANAQLDAEVLQNFMIQLIPSTPGIAQTDFDTAKGSATGNYLYFDNENDGRFTVQVDGEKTSIRSVTEFEYDILRAGDASSDTARAQLKYKVHLIDGSILEGGFILSNVKFSDVTMTGVKRISENPLFFGDN